jgi:streptomycin 6-kinase
MAFRDTLPKELVTHVTSICGARGERWFDRLPETIGELEKEWSVEVGEPFPGIEFNFVAQATMNRQPVVVKIAPPFERTEIYAEARYLRERNGCGAVRLIAEDRGRHAFLMERVWPGVALFKVFENEPPAIVDPAIEVLGSLLRPSPTDRIDVGSLDDWFRNFRRYRGTDFPGYYGEKAFAIYERLSGQPGRTFYLHGDFHPGNIVTSDRAPFLAIDPKGIVGHIGYDIAVFLINLQWWRKDDPNMLDLLSYAIGRFAAAFNLTEREVREWAFAYMVIGAWWSFEDMPELYDTDFEKLNIWDV